MPEKPLSLSLPGGVKIPISRWSVGFFSLVGILAVAGIATRQVFPELPQLISLSEANAKLKIEMDEYGRHFMETPALETRTDGDDLVLKVYDDGCVAIQRKRNGKVSTRLVPDLTQTHQAAAHLGNFKLPSFIPVVEAQGRCLNPHPGQFTQSYGARNGCIVEVWRQFSDGCLHSQLFDSCSNSWQTNGDGSPAVRWARCVH